MCRTRVSLIALLVLAVLTTMLTGCGRKTLIKVNGEKVGKEAFYDRLQKVPVQTQQGAQLAGRYVVQQMISELLIQQLAAEQKVSPTEAQINKKMDFIKKQGGGDIKKIAQQRGMSVEDLKRQVTLEQAFINVATKGVSIPDDKVKKAYDEALAVPNSPFKRPEQVRISGVINKDKAKIDKAYSMLQGGQDFSAVASRYTDDSFGKKSGGQIGWLSRDMKMVPQGIRDAAFSLAVGKYSKPALVQGKWIVIKADMRRPARTTEFKEVKDMIREQMAVKEGTDKGIFRDAITKFTKKADISINNSTYKDIPEQIKKEAAKAVGVPGAKPAATKPIK